MPDQTVLPRWRGFNLLGLFSSHWPGDWEEEDFRWIAELGFDFVRLPMSYRFWVEDDDPFRIAESGLGKIDRGVELARRHGLHVCLNLHRAPGYCVNRGQREPFNLWQDPRGLEAFCLHWATLAARYRHLPGAELSFNLVNEPRAPSDDMSRDDHERVVRAACKAIRDVDPDRPILADGLRWGNDPCPELAGLGIAQSCRAYVPGAISHYKADWTPRPAWEQPVWPGMDDGGQTWDRPALEAHYERWAALARGGVGVHCGEGGAYKFTPHAVVLAWLRDVLDILTGHGIGYALWNFRGPFGILDSGRDDVAYEDFHGHQLDRALLELLREF